jgi:hypothetical protein
MRLSFEFSISLLPSLFPFQKYENWNLIRQIFIHFHSLNTLLPLYKESSREERRISDARKFQINWIGSLFLNLIIIIIIIIMIQRVMSASIQKDLWKTWSGFIYKTNCMKYVCIITINYYCWSHTTFLLGDIAPKISCVWVCICWSFNCSILGWIYI